MNRLGFFFSFRIATSILATTLMLAGPAGASTERTLHVFSGSDGSGSYSRMALIQGKLFGTTENGGKYGKGVVFELQRAKTGWKETVLYSFAGGSDGVYPMGELVADKKGNLFGTTYSGGTNGGGIIFELSPTSGKGWKETVLHTFTGIDGAFPSGGLIADSAGNLYGTASVGGIFGNGTVYRFSLSHGQWVLITIHDFTGKDGSQPWAGLFLDGKGNLYGTTETGARGTVGTVYKLSPSHGRWSFQTLYGFNGFSDGGYPQYGRVVVDKNSSVYGTAIGGGDFLFGVVYKVTLTKHGWRESVLHSFAGGSDGEYPIGSVILDAQGNLYGTTSQGGTGGGGVVFKLTPSSRAWKEKVLQSFSQATPWQPDTSLTSDDKGVLYGTTFVGGPNNAGSVFQIIP